MQKTIQIFDAKKIKNHLQEEKQILFTLEEEMKKAKEMGDDSYYQKLKRERGFSHLLIDLMEIELKEQEIMAGNNSSLKKFEYELFGL